jgi:hypothetical protein
MKKFNFQNRGQGLIGIIIILAIIALIGGGTYYYFSRQIQKVPEVPKKPVEEITKPKEITPPKEEILEEKTTPKKEEKPIVQKCADGTPYGQCSVNKPKYCDNGNLIDKASSCGCPEGYEISDDHCIVKITCKNECTQIGLKGCSDNGYRTCGNYDNDPCLEWGPITSCSEGTICRRGNCIVTISPKPGVDYWGILYSPSIESSFPLFKKILIDNGWQEDHIKYLAGNDATYDNVMKAIDWLAKNSDSNDIVLFFNATHGAPTSVLLADRYLEYSELAEKLNSINYGGFIIIIDACYSGNSIPYLKKENRVIITGTGPEAGGGISGEVGLALQGFADVRGNNDNQITAEEVFNFLRAAERWPTFEKRPQIQDDYPGELVIIESLNDDLRDLDQYDVPSTETAGGCALVGAQEGKTLSVAQSFKPNYPILTKVMVDVYVARGNPGPLTVSIKKDLSGPDLTSVTLPQDVFPPIGSFGRKLTEFDFPDIEVLPGETYYMVFKAPYAPQGENSYCLIDVGNPTLGIDDYPKGTLFVFSESLGLWEYHPIDLEFATFGRPK